jgi:hypothetical protein
MINFYPERNPYGLRVFCRPDPYDKSFEEYVAFFHKENNVWICRPVKPIREMDEKIVSELQSTLNMLNG